MQTEDEMDGMKCEKCGRGFPSQQDLDDHMRMEHGDEGDMGTMPSSGQGDGDMPGQ